MYDFDKLKIKVRFDNVLAYLPYIKSIRASLDTGLDIEFIDDGNTYVIGDMLFNIIIHTYILIKNSIPEDELTEVKCLKATKFVLGGTESLFRPLNIIIGSNRAYCPECGQLVAGVNDDLVKSGTIGFTYDEWNDHKVKCPGEDCGLELVFKLMW